MERRYCSRLPSLVRRRIDAVRMPLPALLTRALHVDVGPDALAGAGLLDQAGRLAVSREAEGLVFAQVRVGVVFAHVAVVVVLEREPRKIKGLERLWLCQKWPVGGPSAESSLGATREGMRGK